MTDRDVVEPQPVEPSFDADSEPPIGERPETTRAPFEPGSRQSLGGRGCAWMVGIGCGLVLLVALGLIAMMAYNGDRLLAWSLGQFEQQVLSDLPEDMQAEQREELESAFETARERMAEGDVDPQALQSFQSIMFEMAFKPPAERSDDDFERLIEALHKVADTPAPPESVPAATAAEAT